MYKIGDIVWLGDLQLGCPAILVKVDGDLWVEGKVLQNLNKFKRGDLVGCYVINIAGFWSKDIIILVGVRKRNPYGFTNQIADIISLCEYRACRAPKLERRTNVSA